MRCDQIGHAVEDTVIARHVAGVHRGSETLFVMSAIYPAIGKPESIRGAVIVEHALRTCLIETLSPSDLCVRQHELASLRPDMYMDATRRLEGWKWMTQS